jgi:hypothetical protein
MSYRPVNIGTSFGALFASKSGECSLERHPKINVK